MKDLQNVYGVPDELLSIVNSGLLKVVSENPGEKTVTFDIPMLASIDHLKRSTNFSIVWIHPDFNAEFCHYFHEAPGDLPNFMVIEEIEDVGNDTKDFDSLDDLLAWLQDLQD